MRQGHLFILMLSCWALASNSHVQANDNAAWHALQSAVSEIDLNDDGKVDSWRQLKDGVVQSSESDSDFNGSVDTWVVYTPTSTVRREDSDGDGIVDVQSTESYYVDKDGKQILTKVVHQHIENKDGKEIADDFKRVDVDQAKGQSTITLLKQGKITSVRVVGGVDGR